jgi:hypothetical protein
MDEAKLGPLVSAHQKKPVKIVKRTNSAKNSPMSALRKAIMPNVQTIEITTSVQKARLRRGDDTGPAARGGLVAIQHAIEHAGVVDGRVASTAKNASQTNSGRASFNWLAFSSSAPHHSRSGWA